MSKGYIRDHGRETDRVSSSVRVQHGGRCFGKYKRCGPGEWRRWNCACPGRSPCCRLPEYRRGHRGGCPDQTPLCRAAIRCSRGGCDIHSFLECFFQPPEIPSAVSVSGISLGIWAWVSVCKRRSAPIIALRFAR